MEIGSCPTCGRPFTAGEITGLGILRTRPARRGGPLMEFACPACGRVSRLIPHGQGRYAPPGVPPPPPVPEAERAPPWAEPGSAGDGAGGPPHAPPPPEDPPPDDETAATIVAPLSPLEALELLGLAPTADREAIERAYRERSRTCHPDKVAHLDHEFQALAEQKFRRLREAYELLTS